MLTIGFHLQFSIVRWFINREREQQGGQTKQENRLSLSSSCRANAPGARRRRRRRTDPAEPSTPSRDASSRRSPRTTRPRCYRPQSRGPSLPLPPPARAAAPPPRPPLRRRSPSGCDTRIKKQSVSRQMHNQKKKTGEINKNSAPREDGRDRRLRCAPEQEQCGGWSALHCSDLLEVKRGGWLRRALLPGPALSCCCACLYRKRRAARVFFCLGLKQQQPPPPPAASMPVCGAAALTPGPDRWSPARPPSIKRRATRFLLTA